jgi:hypothetical protein
MLAYHFLSAANALDDLANRHIKLSEIDKLNDPFELWCCAQGDDGSFFAAPWLASAVSRIPSSGMTAGQE